MTTPIPTLLFVAVLATGTAGLSGCSSDTKVGSDDLLAAGSATSADGGRLGEIEAVTTTAAPADAATPTTAAPAPAPTSAAPPPTSAPAPAPTETVRITADGFEPFDLRVRVGTELTVVNEDSVARSFTADGGAFDSGMLGPGQSWQTTLSRPGRFDVHDESRPFVVGTIEVVAA